jgi:two-component system, OmpR family, sensor kinase
MFNSVRLRLTCWYTAVLACVLTILALTTYFVLRENFTRRTDTSAAEIADSFFATVTAEIKEESGPRSLPRALAIAIDEHQVPEVIFVALAPSGEILATSEQEKPLEEQLKQQLSGLQSFRNIRLNRHRYRSYIRPFASGNTQLTLVLLQSLHKQNEFLENLAGTFFIVIPLTLALASLGGYFLARRSLSPVVAMSKQAEQISTANLRQRLWIKNKNDELGQLAASFNQLLERVDLSFEQQQRFMADASHELRTPVAILFGEADVALSQEMRSEEEYRETLNILRTEAGRLKDIVDGLFTLTRADAGQYPLMLTDFYLDELVNECARNLRTVAAAKGIALNCNADNELPIRADEGLLRRMIMNVLDNAIKYTPPKGEVLISCWNSNSDYCITVRDTGCGIPQELHARIFERFFRVDKARSHEEGSGAGLGLSISAWIAEAHSGKIELSHSGEDGSLFSISLPQSQPRC